MKKIIIVMLLVVFDGFSQEKIGAYRNQIAEENYDVSVGEMNNKGVFTYYIDCKSVDSSSKQCVLLVESDEIEGFKKYLLAVKDVYLKWGETATINKVTELVKEIEVKSEYYKAAFSYGDWNFSYKFVLKSAFKIIDNKYCIVVNNKGNLQSKTNQFMKSNGFMIAFISEKDFDSFINLFDNDLNKNKLLIKKSKEDLFKN
jgi:hypothetical protein